MCVCRFHTKHDGFYITNDGLHTKADGFHAEYDRFRVYLIDDGPSMPGSPDWKERAQTIKFLIDAGYGHRILVGHDTMVLNMMGGNGSRSSRPSLST